MSWLSNLLGDVKTGVFDNTGISDAWGDVRTGIHNTGIRDAWGDVKNGFWNNSGLGDAWGDIRTGVHNTGIRDLYGDMLKGSNQILDQEKKVWPLALYAFGAGGMGGGSGTSALTSTGMGLLSSGQPQTTGYVSPQVQANHKPGSGQDALQKELALQALREKPNKTLEEWALLQHAMDSPGLLSDQYG